MKTIDEWMDILANTDVAQESKGNYMLQWLKAIQSDAFHSGKLSGLADAQAIVRRYIQKQEMSVNTLAL